MSYAEILKRSALRIYRRYEQEWIVEPEIEGQGNEVDLPAATVVSAFGYKAFNPLEETAKAACGAFFNDFYRGNALASR